MPTVLRINGYRFFFYSNENDEPVHIHVQKAENYAKIWIKPTEIAYNHGFTNKQMREIKEAVFSNQTMIEGKWNEYFTK